MEHYQVELQVRQQHVERLTIDLDALNKQIATLRLEKELLENELITTIAHDYEGSKTYDAGIYAVTIKTDMIYALDKKAYSNGDVYLPPEFDPIVEKVTYEVNKKQFNEYEQTAPIEVRQLLNELVEKKPSKPNVSIKVKA